MDKPAVSAASAPSAPTSVSEFVEFVCVKVGGRLRVRITTPGYYNEANCMFPRNLREPGARFRTRRDNVILIHRGAKSYYSSGSKSEIERIDASRASASSPKSSDQIAIYEDTTSRECAICFEKPKSDIINPCGHFYMCHECALQVHQCPICRGPITSLLDFTRMA